NVTPDIENAISMEKALFVANACKVPNVPTDKCGSSDFATKSFTHKRVFET
ncbi:hypothetical protein RYX36_014601, partial [Vicia faba]